MKFRPRIYATITAIVAAFSMVVFFYTPVVAAERDFKVEEQDAINSLNAVLDEVFGDVSADDLKANAALIDQIYESGSVPVIVRLRDSDLAYGLLSDKRSSRSENIASLQGMVIDETTDRSQEYERFVNEGISSPTGTRYPAENELCTDRTDCPSGFACMANICVEAGELTFVQKKLSSSKLVKKPKKLKLKITGDAGFDPYGAVDPGPFILVKAKPNAKKGKLKLVLGVPVDFPAGTYEIWVGNYKGNITINCPRTPDADSDGIGDACDEDTLYGYISGEFKEGIEVNISIQTDSDEEFVDTLITDEDGYYAIGDLEDGWYNVSPDFYDYTFFPNSASVQISTGL